MATQVRTTEISGAGRVFRHDKEFSGVLYVITHEQGNPRRIISGTLTVTSGRTDLLGSSRLTLYLEDGSPVTFGVSRGNLITREFVMDMNNKGDVF